jgi:hypothetical protein
MGGAVSAFTRVCNALCDLGLPRSGRAIPFLRNPASRRAGSCPRKQGITAIPLYDVKQPNTDSNTQHIAFPRRICARVLKLDHPVRGGRSADRRPVLARHRSPASDARGPGRLRGTPASLAIGTPRLSALHAVAIFGLGSAFPAPAFPLEHVQPAPGSTGHSARRAVSEPPESVVTSHDRGTPLPAPPQARLRRRPH